MKNREWISVNDRLPEENQKVIVKYRNGYKMLYGFNRYKNGKFLYADEDFTNEDIKKEKTIKYRRVKIKNFMGRGSYQ